MQLRQLDDSELESCLEFPGDGGVLGMTPAALRAEFEAGRMRPEWTWVAVDQDSRILGRALWWGRDASAPIALDVLDVAPHLESPADLGGRLLLACGQGSPLPHTVRLPMGWRNRPECVDALDWRVRACAMAGLTEQNERLQLRWSAERDTASPRSMRSACTMRAGSDKEFLELFAKVAEGSLDVTTRRAVAATSAEECARDELDFYRSCPGDRDWWRIALDATGTPVGFVIPSATPYARNVGYLGVLPEHRGRGLADEFLAHVTEFHRAAGATVITATTDAVNLPMADAFARAGYRVVETRVDLEAPAG